jgi:VWFA-related protein
MRLFVLAAGLALLASTGPHAQQNPQFRSSTDLVPVFATVVNKDGTFARGLTKEDFTILDNGKAQDIVSFSDEAQAISVSVILDTSGSMATARSRVSAAAAVFLDDLRPDDRATIGSLVFQGPALTADKARLRTALGMMPQDPGSPIFAALGRALTTLAAETNRRVIVIYTDGKNSNVTVVRFGGSRPAQLTPPLTEDQILARVETEGVMVYAIGFEGVSLTGGMKTIAKRSGGRATELKGSDDLSATLKAVADELHHQYLLGFTPTIFDGRPHKIEVRVRPSNLTVRARQTYVARSGG